MRKAAKMFVAGLLIVSALIIVAPRLWVKNKKALLTYNGHISEKIKLFHGRNGMVLFYLPDQDSSGAYVYTSQHGLWRCSNDSFIALKLIALSKRHPSGCAETGNGQSITPMTAQPQSIEFALRGVPVVVSWQAAPR